MDELPLELLIIILIRTDYEDVLRLCLVNTTMYNIIQLPIFWRDKLKYDYGIKSKPMVNLTWRSTYLSIHQLNVYIDEMLNRRIVLSTSNAKFYIINILRKQIDPTITTLNVTNFDILNQLIKQDKIYITKNKESYLLLVRSRGLISYNEFHMKETIRNSADQLIFTGTEFPIDVDYNYIV